MNGCQRYSSTIELPLRLQRVFHHRNFCWGGDRGQVGFVETTHC